MGLDYEVLSQRFVYCCFWLSITIQLLRFKALFLRAGSILPPPLLSVKGSTLREQKTPPIVTACEIDFASALICASAQGLHSFRCMDLPEIRRNLLGKTYVIIVVIFYLSR